MRRRAIIISLAILCLLLGGLFVMAPTIGRWYIESRVLPRVGKAFNRTLTVGEISVRFGRVTLQRLVLTGKQDRQMPVVAVPEVRVEYSTGALLTGELEIQRAELEQPRINLVRLVDGGTNFLDLLQRAKSRKGRGAGATAKLKVALVQVRGGSLALDDRKEQARLTVESVDGDLVPGGASSLRLRSLRLASPRVRSAVRFSKVEIKGRLRRAPRVIVGGGEVQLLPNLRLSGIKGTIAPEPGSRKVQIDLDGSYGGADAKLWSATGWLALDASAGKLRVRAARFSLGRIASILRKTPVIQPRNTMVHGRLDLSYDKRVLTVAGKLAMDRLSLFHPRLARVPVLGISGVAELDGRVDLGQDKLVLNTLSLKSEGVEARLSGEVKRLGGKPHVELRLQVPEVPCQKVLDAFPPSLVPRLRGFEVKGKFVLDLQSDVDFDQLKKAKISGKVSYRRCKVTGVPEAVSAARLDKPFEHQVEPTPRQFVVFTVGPDNENFAPYATISPNIVNAFLTTEDGGFFRHRGFIPSMFSRALARNLQRGGFRLGASTISMQMVKNVLLSHEKTLSRKLQELFLTWYLERELTKERIMEIYLNAIEFGPGIYGIGAATRHYFGKLPSEISPLEAAFFASILPSPKRRYVQYCRGEPTEKWDRYVRRILRRMASKGFVPEEEMKALEGQALTFRRDVEQLPPKDCMERVKELTESWTAEGRRQIREAVMGAAPHQLDLYLPKPSGKTKTK